MYVVVEVGETEVEPLACVEVKLPGVMAMLVAPLVVQLRVELLPDVMVEGLELNTVMPGAVPVPPVPCGPE